MKKNIPTIVVRNIIADILIERSNRIMDDCDRITEEEIASCGASSEYTGELGTEAAGTRVLADDVLTGEISIKEALEVVLNQYEVELAKDRCMEWLNKQNEFER